VTLAVVDYRPLLAQAKESTRAYASPDAAAAEAWARLKRAEDHAAKAEEQAAAAQREAETKRAAVGAAAAEAEASLRGELSEAERRAERCRDDEAEALAAVNERRGSYESDPRLGGEVLDSMKTLALAEAAVYHAERRVTMARERVSRLEAALVGAARAEGLRLVAPQVDADQVAVRSMSGR
jgi:hypothetical protein